jgi:hypothetical protein
MVFVENRAWSLTTMALLHRPAPNGFSKAVLFRIAQDREQMMAEGVSRLSVSSSAVHG